MILMMMMMIIIYLINTYAGVFFYLFSESYLYILRYEQLLNKSHSLNAPLSSAFRVWKKNMLKTLVRYVVNVIILGAPVVIMYSP